MVVVGRLAPVKRQQMALESLAAAREDHPDLTVDLVGDGPDRPAIEKWVNDNDADGWVQLRGRVSDEELVEAYRRAWLVVSASHAEGWGMSLTEGGACGTPCVATDIAGHAEAAIADTTGLLVADPIEMGAALTALLSDDDRRRGFAKAAMRHAEGLSWNAVAARQLDLLADRVASGR